jgi:hypothetical protein
MVQVHHQIDGPTAAHTAIPVHELGSGDREDPLGGVPFALIVSVGLGSAQAEHRF